MLRPCALTVELSILTDEDRIAHFDRVFVELLGGDDVWRMLVDHYQGYGYRVIGKNHGVSHMTARRWITSAKAAIRRVGLDATVLESRVRDLTPCNS